MDEPIKLAFQKVKRDIDSLKGEFDSLKHALIEEREKISKIAEILTKLNEKIEDFNFKKPSLHPTDNPENPAYPTHIPTDNTTFKPLKGQNKAISTGNEGVPTDKQTNRQTDQQTENKPFDEVLDVLNSLDNLKKEVRLKFKRITDQEFLVFSTIYQLSEEVGYTDYRAISQRLKLTESSIRDYVGRLIKKGIPVEKNKINNKLIQLSISEKLKKIAPLAVIMQLRGL